MFHSETPRESKDKVIEEPKNPKSVQKLVIATTTLGMGFDCVNFDNVTINFPTVGVDTGNWYNLAQWPYFCLTPIVFMWMLK